MWELDMITIIINGRQLRMAYTMLLLGMSMIAAVIILGVQASIWLLFGVAACDWVGMLGVVWLSVKELLQEKLEAE